MHAFTRLAPSVTWVVLLVAVSLSLPTLVGGVGATTAQDEATGAAGFIVDTGEGDPIYVVVTFAEPSMSAVDLLRAAELDAVTVEFGGLGEAVCEIADTGCDISSCRQRLCQTGDPESPFWQYWEQRDDGTWALSPRGASHATVDDGDIAAWAWTGVRPDLQPLDWRELTDKTGAPDTLVSGDVSGEPAVFASGVPLAENEASDPTGTIAAAGVIAVVGVIGGWLVVHRRNVTQVTP